MKSDSSGEPPVIGPQGTALKPLASRSGAAGFGLALADVEQAFLALNVPSIKG
jgi:hypothetical protein